MKWALVCLIRNRRYNLFENCQHIVGRGKGCLIKVPSLFASKYHCVIVTKEDRIYVVDAKSSNGTYVNGHPIESIQPYLLKENDIIGIGVQGPFDRRHAVFRLMIVDDMQQSGNPVQYNAAMQLDSVENAFDEEAISAIFSLNLNLN